ncbi:hypothetical protein [Saccharothrix xinjiangensis]|uniref:Uncharacterized protein n=1 Tax=Saccharothrix xinjiangensis TaxID=204798 RepID=A0ABV9XW64_9PSEU
MSIAAFARQCDLVFETARRAVKGLAVPEEETLARIAEHVPASLEELRRMAGLAGEIPRPIVLPPAFARLSAARRRLLISVGWALVAAQDAEDTAKASGRDLPHYRGDAEVLPLDTGGDDQPRGRVTRAARRRPDHSE